MLRSISYSCRSFEWVIHSALASLASVSDSTRRTYVFSSSGHFSWNHTILRTRSAISGAEDLEVCAFRGRWNQCRWQPLCCLAYSKLRRRRVGKACAGAGFEDAGSPRSKTHWPTSDSLRHPVTWRKSYIVEQCRNLIQCRLSKEQLWKRAKYIEVRFEMQLETK